MYRSLGDLPSAPAWDAISGYTFAQLVALGASQATGLIQAAAREAATLRVTAQNAGDSATALVMSRREFALESWQAQVSGAATSNDIRTLAEQIPSGGLDALTGALKTAGLVAGVALAAILLGPTVVRVIGQAGQRRHAF